MTDGGYTLTEAWNLQLQGRLGVMAASVRKAAARFRDYQQIHLAKGFAGQEKAASNARMAAELEAVAAAFADAIPTSPRWLSVVQKVLDGVTIEAVPRDGQETPCWIWTGPDSGNGRGGGYPRMSLDGQTVAVHRVVYTQFFGYVPGRKQIDHTCRNRRCVSPFHLEMVTHRQNMKRRDRANGLD